MLRKQLLARAKGRLDAGGGGEGGVGVEGGAGPGLQLEV